MSDESPKRRALPVVASEPERTMLNEVLPDPRHTTSTIPPRERVLAHMKHLLAAATLTAALGAGCASATPPVDLPTAKPGGHTEPMAEESPTDDTQPTAANALGVPHASADSGHNPHPTPRPRRRWRRRHGYEVVDMMPSPKLVDRKPGKP